MSHRVTSVYRVLEAPTAYHGLQSILGGPAAFSRFVREFVRPGAGARLLDIGCGTGTLLKHLPESVIYVGYDLNSTYIETARRRFPARGVFHCARVGSEIEGVQRESFDVIVAAGLLHHLSDEEAAALARSVVHLLAPSGVFVTIDPTFHAGQGLVARTLARLDRGSAVRTFERYRTLLEPYFGDVHQWLVTDMLRIPYSHCVVRATLANCQEQPHLSDAPVREKYSLSSHG